MGRGRSILYSETLSAVSGKSVSRLRNTAPGQQVCQSTRTFAREPRLFGVLVTSLSPTGIFNSRCSQHWRARDECALLVRIFIYFTLRCSHGKIGLVVLLILFWNENKQKYETYISEFFLDCLREEVIIFWMILKYFTVFWIFVFQFNLCNKVSSRISFRFDDKIGTLHFADISVERIEFLSMK